MVVTAGTLALLALLAPQAPPDREAPRREDALEAAAEEAVEELLAELAALSARPEELLERLRSARADLALQALERVGRGATGSRAALAEALHALALEIARAEDSTLEERVLALGTLAPLGQARDLDACLRLARGAERESARALAPALRRILEREEAAALGLVAMANDQPLRVQGVIAAAAAAARTRTSLAELPRMLGLHASLDATVLSELWHAATRGAPALPADRMARVRAYLDAPQAMQRKLAAAALGALGDDAAVPALVERLSDTDEAVRASAHGALRALSGHGWHLDAERWRRWYEREQAWWQEAAPRLFVALGGRPDAAAAAVREIARRRLFRRELARELTRVLQRPEPELLALACSALASLRVAESAPELERLTTHGDPRVRERAREALAALGGKLPPSNAPPGAAEGAH